MSNLIITVCGSNISFVSFNGIYFAIDANRQFNRIIPKKIFDKNIGKSQLEAIKKDDMEKFSSITRKIVYAFKNNLRIKDYVLKGKEIPFKK